MLTLCDLGRDVPYGEAFELQKRLVTRRAAGEIGDLLLLLEHRPVYTMGRNAAESNILASREALAAAGIDVCETTRGGDVTYHGPGQLVGYPIIDLGPSSREIVGYVAKLERVLIELLAQYGLEAGTDKRNRGVWIGNSKIAALGVRVTRGVTMHGFALNVDPEMNHFLGIVPCGIQGAGVTSMREQLGDAPEMTEVKARCLECFRNVFGVDAVEHVDEDAL